MANLRVFVSSTCYDLRQVRDNLRDFISGCGYLPVMNEHQGIPYNVTESLETDCYSEINNCDIVVGIVGGKFGSESRDKDGKSISMKEMLSAMDSGKQVYIFIDRDVDGEHKTYVKQRQSRPKDKLSSDDYCTVDSIAIFEFISDIRKNSRLIITPFSNASDIVDTLKLQWANLFQNLLNNRERNKQDSVLADFTSKFDEFVAQSKQVESLLDKEQYKHKRWHRCFHPMMIDEIFHMEKITDKKLFFKMIFAPIAREIPWLYDVLVEIIELPNRTERKRKLEEVRRISKFMGHPEFCEYEMDDFHEIFRGGFWKEFEYALERMDDIKKSEKENELEKAEEDTP